MSAENSYSKEEVDEMAEEIADTGAMTFAQAQVYIFREIFEKGRDVTAMTLGKSPNTVDNLYAAARKNARQARELTETINRLNDPFGKS